MRYPLAAPGSWHGDANYAATGGRLVYMTPAAYLAKVRPLERDEVTADNVDSLKRHILAGRSLDPLAIYPNGKEDGRHRALASLELGISRVPVLVWTVPKPHRATGKHRGQRAGASRNPVLARLGGFKIGRRTYYFDRIAEIARAGVGKYAVTMKSGATWIIEGGRAAGGTARDWYVDSSEGGKTMRATSLVDGLRLLDGM
jgi:hypothetical protein